MVRNLWPLAMAIALGSPLVAAMDAVVATAVAVGGAVAQTESPAASTLLEEGQALFYRGELAAAEETLKRALTAYQGAGNQGGEAAALVALSLTYNDYSRRESARQAAQQALEIYQGLDHEAGVADALAALGYAQEDGADGVALLEKALQIYQERGDRLGEAQTRMLYGGALLRSGELEAAVTQLEAARAQLGDGQSIESLYYRGVTALYGSFANLRTENFDQAEARADEAIALNQELGNALLEGNALYGKGLAHLRRERLDEALTQLRLALTAIRSSDNATSSADILTDIARTYRQQEVYEPALDSYQAALALFESHDNFVAQYNVLTEIGLLYHDQEQYLKASEVDERSAEAAIALLNETEGEAAIARVNGLIAASYRSAAASRGRYGNEVHADNRLEDALTLYAQAVSLAQVALPYAQASGDAAYFARVQSTPATYLIPQGQIHYALQNYDESITLHRQALEVLQSVSPTADVDLNHRINQNRYSARSGLRNSFVAMGEQRLDAGEYAQALSAYGQALEYAQAVLVSARELKVEADSSERREAWQNSERLALQSLVGAVYPGLATVYLAQYNDEAALAIYQTMRELLAQFDPPDLNRTYRTLQAMQAAYSNLDRYTDALVVQQELLVVAEQKGDPEDTYSVHVMLGNSYDAVGQLPEAVQQYKQALEIAEVEGWPLEQQIALKFLGGDYWSQGRYDLALTALNQGLELSRSLTSGIQAATTREELAEYCGLGFRYSLNATIERHLYPTINHKLYPTFELAQQFCLEQAATGEVSALNNIALVYQTQGRYQEAIELQQVLLERKLAASGLTDHHKNQSRRLLTIWVASMTLKVATTPHCRTTVSRYKFERKSTTKTELSLRCSVLARCMAIAASMSKRWSTFSRH